MPTVSGLFSFLIQPTADNVRFQRFIVPNERQNPLDTLQKQQGFQRMCLGLNAVNHALDVLDYKQKPLPTLWFLYNYTVDGTPESGGIILHDDRKDPVEIILNIGNSPANAGVSPYLARLVTENKTPFDELHKRALCVKALHLTWLFMDYQQRLSEKAAQPVTHLHGTALSAFKEIGLASLADDEARAFADRIVGEMPATNFLLGGIRLYNSVR